MRYRDTSAATDITYRFRRADTNEQVRLFIPGWIRERAAEVLFDGLADEDVASVVQCTLQCFLSMKADLRACLITRVLVVGGTAQLPNFQPRLHQEMVRSMLEDPKYIALRGLANRVQFLTNPEQGSAFPANCRIWVGGSLIGALKINLPEVTKEQWNGTVPDWTCQQE